MAKLGKLRASTLIESIVSMVIITLLFGISFSILSSVAGRNNAQLKLKALLEAQRVVAQCKSEGDFNNQYWKIEGLTIEKTIKNYHDYKEIRLIEVSIFNNNGKLLIQKHELINISK